MKSKLAILGAGNMGLAITDGILKTGIIAAEDIILVRRNVERLSSYCEKGCTVTSDVRSATDCADVILLAFKPQMMNELFLEIADLCNGKLVISIAAGITVEKIEKALVGARVVRAMPNTPLTVGEGVTELCRSTNVSDSDMSFVKRLFEGAGCTIECREEEINAFTALTSSAVAYFAAFENAMCEWAAENGLSDYQTEDIRDLVCKTAIGASRLMIDRNISPEDLIRSVASPNGTTERALRVFDEENINGIIGKAMTACRDRADELSKL